MSADLKPCPFCNGEARRVDFTATDDEVNAGGSLIECTKCLASSAVHFGRKENLHDSWNRRAPTDAEERGRLKGLEQAAKVADEQAADLAAWSERLKAEGREDDMYRANTAWHRVMGVADAIRALADKTEEKVG